MAGSVRGNTTSNRLSVGSTSSKGSKSSVDSDGSRASRSTNGESYGGSSLMAPVDEGFASRVSLALPPSLHTIPASPAMVEGSVEPSTNTIMESSEEDSPIKVMRSHHVRTQSKSSSSRSKTWSKMPAAPPRHGIPTFSHTSATPASSVDSSHHMVLLPVVEANSETPTKKTRPRPISDQVLSMSDRERRNGMVTDGEDSDSKCFILILPTSG